ncbi:FAD-binding oxidoreductase [Thioclava sp. BHET1]|nr:FAD-binding oxidoreductase [Thioclava sp. BHET1]
MAGEMGRQGLGAAEQLRAALGDDMVSTDAAVIARYCQDWHGDVTSSALALLRPRSTQEVSQAVRLCAELGLGVVPQGGRSGLALGAVPDAPEAQVALSLERMDQIRSLNARDFTATVEAGVVLEAFKTKVSEAGLYFPVALGAQGTCQIGGNVSTNAGGVNVLRYGMTRELVLGLEVVLPDGRVLDLLSRLRKDNRSLDLKQLFIGAEGVLGIVTAVSFKLMPAPDQVATALLALDTLDDVIELYRVARRQCCDLMSAFEFMPASAFALAREGIPDLALPLDPAHRAYALVELSGSGLVDIEALLSQFLELAMEEGLVRDGVVAQSKAQARNIWLVREGMNEGQARRGKHLRTDLSVPLSELAAFVTEAEAAVERALPGAVCVSYGHVGDGNVHLNVLPNAAAAETVDQQIDRAKTVLNEVLDRYDGSISAEHGLGRLKKADFAARASSVHSELLERIKRAIDPASTMNPGCQFDLRVDRTGAE